MRTSPEDRKILSALCKKLGGSITSVTCQAWRVLAEKEGLKRLSPMQKGDNRMKPFSILLFIALALPAFANSDHRHRQNFTITDLGPETQTNYVIGINENGSPTETVYGTGGSSVDGFNFEISDPLGNGHFGQGLIAIAGNGIDIEDQTLTNIYLNPKTDVLTGNVDGDFFDAPLTHVGQSFLAVPSCNRTSVPAGDNWLCLGAGLLAMAGAMRRRLA